MSFMVGLLISYNVLLLSMDVLAKIRLCRT